MVLSSKVEGLENRSSGVNAKIMIDIVLEPVVQYFKLKDYFQKAPEIFECEKPDYVLLNQTYSMLKKKETKSKFGVILLEIEAKKNLILDLYDEENTWKIPGESSYNVKVENKRKKCTYGSATEGLNELTSRMGRIKKRATLPSLLWMRRLRFQKDYAGTLALLIKKR